MPKFSELPVLPPQASDLMAGLRGTQDFMAPASNLSTLGGNPYTSVNTFAPAGLPFGNGVADDTAVFAAAMASLGSLGGTVYFNRRHYIAGPLTIPTNVTLRGPFSLIGGPNAIIQPAYGLMAALVLNTANSIFVSTGAGIDGALIVPQGMTFPQTVSTGWVGTAVQLVGDNAFVINSMILGFNQGIISGPVCTFTGSISNGVGGAGIILAASAVTGTIRAGMVLYSNSISPLSGTCVLTQTSGTPGGAGNYTVSISQNLAAEALIGNIGQGPKFFNNKIDCNNGILINNPQDTGHCFNVECFPYATIPAVAKPSNWADRLGTAFSIQTTFGGSGANCTLYDCFAFGYLNGFISNATNDAIYDGCWADGTGALANAAGFQIIGGFGGAENKLTACVASGQQIGFYINNNLGTETMMVHITCSANEVSAAAFGNKQIWINSGDAYIIGATVRGSGSGGSGGRTDTAVYISGAASRVIIDGLRAQGLNGTVPPIYNFGLSPYLFIGINDFSDFTLGQIPVYQYVPQSVVSAGVITTLPLTGDTFFLTGSSGIGGMTGSYPGRRVRLIMVNGLSVVHGNPAPNGFLLAGGIDTFFPAGSILELTYMVTSGFSGQWVQTSPMPVLQAGWGTPTGPGVVTNFPGGGPATLAQCSNAIAMLITVMKQYGILAA
jgi:hypothetical protein